MDLPKQMKILGDHARFAPEGEASVAELVALVSQAIRYCREQKISRLLADVRGLTGYGQPQVHERYWAVREWAREANGALVLCVLAQEGLLDPQRFGVLVARNAGLRAFISSNENEALEWLLGQEVY
jgi:hypothetical protein